MSKECERQIHVWPKGLANRPNHRSESGKCWLLHARTAPGELNGQDLDDVRQILLPGAKRGFAAARIRKTKQAHFCL
jgi:hypothetical protein